MKKKIICLVLAICTLISMLPSTFAADFTVDTSIYEYAIFPAKQLNLSQIAFETASHGDQNAIDILTDNALVAPFTGTIVYRDPNWGYVMLQSNEKVRWADGTIDYMSVGFMHDSDISDLPLNKEVKKGTEFYHPGGQGGVYEGNVLQRYSSSAYSEHVHITVHRGKVKRGYPYGNGDVFAYNAFYIDDKVTTSQAGRGEGYAVNSVNYSAPSDYRGLWKNLNYHPYLNNCTYYPSSLTIKTVNKTTIKTLPCSYGTHNESTDVRILKKGEILTVTGLYANSYNNYWYRVELSDIDRKISGVDVGYVYAGDTEVVAKKTNASIVGVAAPQSLHVGNAFSIKGQITSRMTTLTDVFLTVTSGGRTVISSSDSVYNNVYELYNSVADLRLKFNHLSAGSYIYNIIVREKTYYSAGNKLYSTTFNTTVYSSDFNVN